MIFLVAISKTNSFLKANNIDSTPSTSTTLIIVVVAIGICVLL
jgi:hypothetical protein